MTPGIVARYSFCASRRPHLPHLLAAHGIFIALGLTRGLLGVAWPSIQAMFAVPHSALGILMFVATMGYIAASLNIGYLTAHWNIGSILIAGTLLLTMSVFSCSLVPHWWGFVGSTLLTGIAMGVLDPGLNAYAATSFSARQLNWLHASFGIGITISPAVLTILLVYEISWQWGYVLIALLIAGLTVWLVKVRTCWHTSATTTTRKASRETPNFAYLLSMPMVWVILGIFFLYPLEGIVGQWTFILLTEGRAIPIGIAGFWVSIYWGMLTLGRILMGVVADRIHTKKLLRLCMIGLVAGAVCIWMPVSTEVNFFGVALMGIAVAPIYPLLIVQTPDRVDVSVVPSIVGLQSCASGLGGAMLPALAGILVDGMGIQSVGGYMVILALLMVLLHELALRIPAQPVDLKGGETTYV